MRVGGQCHSPAALPPEKNQYPLYRRSGGPPGPIWTGAENLSPTGIRSRTVQPVASRYTDWAIPTPYFQSNQRYLLYVTIQINLLIDVLCF